MAKSRHKASLLFIFITILIDVIGIGIIIPVFPALIQELTGDPLNVAAQWGGWLMMAYAISQFLFAPLMGEISDRFGRKPILLIALFGLGLDYYFHAVAPTIMWLFVGRIFAGMCGASFTVGMAYIADISTKETKAKNFGLVGAAFGVGFVIGPAIGGLCAEVSTQFPFYMAAGFSLLNFLFGLFIIPESLPKSKRRNVKWSRAIPGVSLAHINKYGGAFLILLISFTFLHLAGQVMPAIWTFFTIEMYGWEEWMVGVSLMVVGLLVGGVQGGLTGYASKRFGNKRVIRFGLIVGTIGMVAFAFAFNELLLFLFLIPYIFSGLVGPTIQAVMSNKVDEEEQGNLQGLMTGLISVALIFGPILYTTLFHFYSGHDSGNYFPGAPFIMAGIIMFIGTIVAFVALKKMGNIDPVGKDEISDPELIATVKESTLEDRVEVIRFVMNDYGRLSR